MLIDVGNIITIVTMVIGCIVGYANLRSQVRQHDLEIDMLTDSCEKCRQNNLKKINEVTSKYDTRFLKVLDLISSIKNSTSKIANLISRISGIILTYMKFNKHE